MTVIRGIVSSNRSIGSSLVDAELESAMPFRVIKVWETAVANTKPGKSASRLPEVNLRILDFELEGLKNSSMTSSAQNSHFQKFCPLISDVGDSLPKIRRLFSFGF